MEENNEYIREEYRKELRRRALQYMPKRQDNESAQVQIVEMVAGTIPTVTTCIDRVKNEIWPKVAKNEIPVNHAIAQCAYQTDRVIGITVMDNLRLEDKSEETLLMAWIALDYYAYVLKEAYSVNIRKAQNHVALALRNIGTTAKEETQYPNAELLVNQNEQPDCNSDIQTQNEQVEAKDMEISARNSVVTVQQNRTHTTKEKATTQKRKKNSNILVLAAALAIGLAVLVASVLLNKPRQLERAINSIGTVSMDSGDRIADAERRYSDLADEQRSKVSNYDALVEARAEYDRLVTQTAIDEIGKVTMESEGAIVKAEQLYRELPQTKQKSVENYKILTAARKEYDRLAAAVKNASDSIDAIGAVTLESGSKINAARNAYDALAKDKLQPYVADKVETLIQAEKAYTQCVSEDIYNTGVELYNEGKHEDALKNFNAIISDYSETSCYNDARKGVADCKIALAQAAFKKKDQYKAMTLLNEVEKQYQSTTEYQELMKNVVEKLESSRPKSGKSLKTNIGWGYCYYHVTAGSEDICVKVEDATDSTKFILVYIRAGENKQIKIKDGTYILKYASGKYWYGVDQLFGDETQFKRRPGTTTFTTERKGSWIYYWYNTVDLGKNDLNWTNITAEQF